MEKILKVCLRKNLKLHPDKLQIGGRVTFGGVTIEACKTEGDNQRRVYIFFFIIIYIEHAITSVLYQGT